MMQTDAFNAAMGVCLEAVLLERWATRAASDPWLVRLFLEARSASVSCYAQINPEMEAFLFRVFRPGAPGSAEQPPAAGRICSSRQPVANRSATGPSISTPATRASRTVSVSKAAN